MGSESARFGSFQRPRDVQCITHHHPIPDTSLDKEQDALERKVRLSLDPARFGFSTETSVREANPSKNDLS